MTASSSEEENGNGNDNGNDNGNRLRQLRIWACPPHFRCANDGNAP